MAADARIRELELAEKQGDLIPFEEIKNELSATVRALRQRFDSLPSEAAHLCNPTDPDHARKALEGWLAQSLPLIRADLERFRKTPAAQST
jgi:hypothetical protein